IEIVTQPLRGEAIPQDDGTVRYVPDPGFIGRDFFEYRISDNEGGESNVARVDTEVVASRLVNPDNNADVNDDGFVTALDALLIINRLDRDGGSGEIPVLPTDSGPNYYDVNGNQTITANDALIVINTLAENSRGSGEEILPIAEATQSTDEEVVTPAVADLAGTAKIVSTKASGSVSADVLDLLAADQDGDDEEASADAIDAVMSDVL
ncbi:MAG: dockerin type I domain-containing protein, partial [Rubripirellula sp.]